MSKRTEQRDAEMIVAAEKQGINIHVKLTKTYYVENEHCHTAAKALRLAKKKQCVKCHNYVFERDRGDGELKKKPLLSDVPSNDFDGLAEYWEDKWLWWQMGCRAGLRGRTVSGDVKWWDFVPLPCPGFEHRLCDFDFAQTAYEGPE